MEYTVQQLARLAGISSRAVRYYDEIGLLKPARISSSGYRIYGQNEVDTLQQIMFYRELGMGLEEIHKILSSPGFNRTDALKEHRIRLLEKRKQLDVLISNVERSIAAAEGRISMKDNEKFEGFIRRALEENERKYGKEAREKYGAEAVEKSNQKWLNMTEEQYREFTALSEELIKTLKEAYNTGDPASETAQKAADLHRQWLCFTWPVYSKEAHAGLVQMYVDDERFKEYYDKHQPGLAEFLRDAVMIYTER
ncbi:MAG TPA: MerR family transcriptional regulator [Clostridiales bacterium]|nr:MerR family transcriptional regulator [Clostridiales bacterium]